MRGGISSHSSSQQPCSLARADFPFQREYTYSPHLGHKRHRGTRCVYGRPVSSCWLPQRRPVGGKDKEMSRASLHWSDPKGAQLRGKSVDPRKGHHCPHPKPRNYSPGLNYPEALPSLNCEGHLAGTQDSFRKPNRMQSQAGGIGWLTTSPFDTHVHHFLFLQTLGNNNVGHYIRIKGKPRQQMSVKTWLYHSLTVCGIRGKSFYCSGLYFPRL